MSTMVFTQENRTLRVFTSLAEDHLILQRVAGREELSRPYEYHLVLQSHDKQIDGKAIVGHRLTVEYRDYGDRKRYLDGFVCQFGYLGQSGDQATYKATLVPWLWFLKNRSDCRIFQEMTVVDIIKQVFADHGFAEFEIKLEEDYHVREYCVQYRETDFNFVSRLMEEEGIFYYFKHENGKHTMYLCDATSHYYELEDAEATCCPNDANKAQIRSWQHSYGFYPGRVAQKDYNFIQPLDPLDTKNENARYEVSDQLEIYEYPGRYYAGQVGNRLTKVRMEEIKAEKEHAVGTSTYLSFAPGGKFKLQDNDRYPSAPTFVITYVSLDMTNNLGTSGGELSQQNSFHCIPAETIFRPQRLTPKPIVEGPQTAVVTTDGKEEIVVDEYGRVKVQFPWDRYGKKDFHSSCWIRVSQVHAGREWGAMDIPRRDEEVVVSFINGDPDCPLITGRVYNGINVVPYNMGGTENNRKGKMLRGMISKSYLETGYNELSLDDTAGKEKIYLRAERDQEEFVKNDSKTRIYGNRHEAIGWEKDGKKGGDENRLIYQDQNLNVKRNQQVQIEGNSGLTVGKGEAESGGNYDVVIEKNKTEWIEGDSLEVIDGSFKSEIGGQASLHYKGGLQLKVEGDMACEAAGAGEIHLKAGTKVIIEAGAQISLVGPGGFVDIGPSGVTIQGIMVLINSGGAAGSGKGCSVESPPKAQIAAPAKPAVALTSNSRMKAKN